MTWATRAGLLSSNSCIPVATLHRRLNTQKPLHRPPKFKNAILSPTVQIPSVPSDVFRRHRRLYAKSRAEIGNSDKSSNRFPAEQKEEFQRLFSALNETTLEHKPGSVISAVLLVAGTTVGAGILAIPAVTKDAGFVASVAVCIGCWAYMVTTGLLIAEVCVNTMCELGSGGTSLVSMAERTLGKGGAAASIVTYVFIHYALLVAYVARASEIIANATGLPLGESALLFTLIFGGLCFFGSTEAVGSINGVLVLGVLLSFGVIVGSTAGDLSLLPLAQADISAIPSSIPIIIVAFVYQNVVPVIATSLEGDLSRIRTAVVAGTAIPLAMFLVWDAVILATSAADTATAAATAAAAAGAGSPQQQAAVTVAASMAAADPLLELRQSGALGPVLETFSLLAIATSYIGFVLGLSDFIADWLKLPRSSLNQRPPLSYLLTLVPPLALALVSPGIFFAAVDLAGTYGVLVLFGIIPAGMAWVERYLNPSGPPLMAPPLVPGGKVTLAIVIVMAAIVIASELWKHIFETGPVVA